MECRDAHPVSKRLQVVMPDDEYRALVATARRRGQPVARVVRESLRRSLEEESETDPDRRIAAVLRFARFAGPTGDIEHVLADIDHGRHLP
jgi:hypothetical protein